MELLRIRGKRKYSYVFVSVKKCLLSACGPTYRSGNNSENVPDLSDIRFMGEILTQLGADVSKPATNTWKIRPANIQPNPPYELVRKCGHLYACLVLWLLG